MTHPPTDTERLVDSQEKELRAQDLLISALQDALTSKDEEINTLRLAICGGEDAPGYAASLPLATILQVAADNLRAWRDASDQAVRQAGEIERLRGALEPFSHAAAHIDPEARDEREWGTFSRPFTVGEIRRAAAAYRLSPPIAGGQS